MSVPSWYALALDDGRCIVVGRIRKGTRQLIFRHENGNPCNFPSIDVARTVAHGLRIEKYNPKG